MTFARSTRRVCVWILPAILGAAALSLQAGCGVPMSPQDLCAKMFTCNADSGFVPTPDEMQFCAVGMAAMQAMNSDCYACMANAINTCDMTAFLGCDQICRLNPQPELEYVAIGNLFD